MACTLRLTNLLYFFLCKVSFSIAAVLFVIGFRQLTVLCLFLQRPPSSSLSYPGPGNEDVRSPGSGGTPGPLSQQPSSQQSVDNSDPGKTTAIQGAAIHGQGFLQVELRYSIRVLVKSMYFNEQ